MFFYFPILIEVNSRPTPAGTGSVICGPGYEVGLIGLWGNILRDENMAVGGAKNDFTHERGGVQGPTGTDRRQTGRKE